MIPREEAVRRGMACLGRGHMLPEELAWLWDLAAKAPNGPAVEIGVLCGRSIVAWSGARYERGPVWASDIVDRGELRLNLAALPYRVEVAIAPSWEAAAMVPDGLAFCFIDADHGIDGIPKDILPWTAKIRPGGIVVFHDYGVWKPTVVVKRYVDLWQKFAKWEELGAVRSAQAYRRPG